MAGGKSGGNSVQAARLVGVNAIEKGGEDELEEEPGVSKGFKWVLIAPGLLAIHPAAG